MGKGKLAKSSQAKMTSSEPEPIRFPMCHLDEFGERWQIWGTVEEHWEWEKQYGMTWPRKVQGEANKGL